MDSYNRMSKSIIFFKIIEYILSISQVCFEYFRRKGDGLEWIVDLVGLVGV